MNVRFTQNKLEGEPTGKSKAVLRGSRNTSPVDEFVITCGERIKKIMAAGGKQHFEGRRAKTSARIGVHRVTCHPCSNQLRPRRWRPSTLFSHESAGDCRRAVDHHRVADDRAIRLHLESKGNQGCQGSAQAHLLAVRLFQDQLHVVMGAYSRILRAPGRYLKLAFMPLLYVIIPINAADRAIGSLSGFDRDSGE